MRVQLVFSPSHTTKTSKNIEKLLIPELLFANTISILKSLDFDTIITCKLYCKYCKNILKILNLIP